MQFTINKINVDEKTLQITLLNIPHIIFTIKPSSKDIIDYDIYNMPYWEHHESLMCYEEGCNVIINDANDLRKLIIK